ncbi:MAG: hypothetical protein DHS20C14_11450 [Phycisphaeraceae bacterium]|nr:MAG: hypothetical protein DHS20C14_11450 [Phycisphaeraceae bacterium]
MRIALRLAQLVLVGCYTSLTLGLIIRMAASRLFSGVAGGLLDQWWVFAFNHIWMVVLAIGLIIVERVLIGWVVPAPIGGCVGCGYELSDLARCPECGLLLTAHHDPQPPAPPA